MERQPPSKILQLKGSMYHANFCIKYETIGPPRRLGDCHLLSMKEKYHAYDLVISFTCSVRHRVRLVGSGTGRLELY